MSVTSDSLQPDAADSSLASQLRKIKDLPRILQRLRLTQGLLDSRDFQSMLDRCSPKTCCHSMATSGNLCHFCRRLLTETDSIPRL